MTPVARHIRPRVEEALSDTRIVVVQGARQVGKTTLVRDIIADRAGRLVTLDDELTRVGAEADPVGFLQSAADGILAIDEVQRAPRLMLALKQEVDRDPRPGRFLITGSADLLRLPTAEDSLAGRAESFELYGFSQGELSSHREHFIDRALDGDRFLDATSSLVRSDYLEVLTAGAYPEVLSRTSRRRRADWQDNYLQRIVQRDATDLTDSRRVADLPLVLRMLAARNSEELNVTDLSKESGIPATTLHRLIDLLKTLYLIERTPAWSTNLSKRVVSRPKIALLDSGLAARLLGISAAGASPQAYPQIAGHLLEGFIAAELRKQLTWADARARLNHYRDRAGAEVDLILESDDGRVVGIEVKSSASVSASDTRWLAQVRDRLGARFSAGYVLHTGREAVSLGDRLSAIPVDTIWRS
jgi:predicted AAA+ superfamily ATPase